MGEPKYWSPESILACPLDFGISGSYITVLYRFTMFPAIVWPLAI